MIEVFFKGWRFKKRKYNSCESCALKKFWYLSLSEKAKKNVYTELLNSKLIPMNLSHYPFKIRDKFIQKHLIIHLPTDWRRIMLSAIEEFNQQRRRQLTANNEKLFHALGDERAPTIFSISH